MAPLLALVTAILAYAAFQQGALQNHHAALLGIAIGAIAAIWWLGPQRDRPPTEWLVPILLTAASVLAALRVVPGPLADEASGRAVLSVVRLAACLLLVLTARDLTWRARSTLWPLALPILVVAALESVLGLAQTAFGTTGTAPFGTWSTPDHFASFLALSLPLALMGAVWLFRRDRHKYETPAQAALQASALLAISAALVVDIFFSLSHAASLPALIAIALTGLLSFVGPSMIRRVLAILAIVLSLAAGLALGGPSGLPAASPLLGPALPAALALTAFAIESSLGAAAFSAMGKAERYLGVACVASLVCLVLQGATAEVLSVPSTALAASWILGIALGLRRLRPAQFTWKAVG